MKKARTATEEIEAYFKVAPSGKQRVKMSKVDKEFPSKGRLDASTPSGRFGAWAHAHGYNVVNDGDSYVVTKA